MYYISRVENNCSVSVRKKRLGDFKGEEGARFHVRKRKEVEMLDFIPVYEIADGKLKRVNELHTMWL
jgi:hypothetical protein